MGLQSSSDAIAREVAADIRKERMERMAAGCSSFFRQLLLVVALASLGLAMLVASEVVEFKSMSTNNAFNLLFFVSCISLPSWGCMVNLAKKKSWLLKLSSLLTIIIALPLLLSTDMKTFNIVDMVIFLTVLVTWLLLGLVNLVWNFRIK